MNQHLALLLCTLFLLPWKLMAASGDEITPEVFLRQMDEAFKKAHEANPTASPGPISLKMTQSGKITKSDFKFYYTNNISFWDHLLHLEEVTGCIEVEFDGDTKAEQSMYLSVVREHGGFNEIPPTEKTRWAESLEIMTLITKAYVDYYKVKAGFSAQMTNDVWEISPEWFPQSKRYPDTLIFFSSEHREVRTFSKNFADYLKLILKDRGFPVKLLEYRKWDEAD